MFFFLLSSSLYLPFGRLRSFVRSSIDVMSIVGAALQLKLSTALVFNYDFLMTNNPSDGFVGVRIYSCKRF